MAEITIKCGDCEKEFTAKSYKKNTALAVLNYAVWNDRKPQMKRSGLKGYKRSTAMHDLSRKPQKLKSLA